MSLGSPLIWKILSDYCLAHDIRLPSLKRVFMFGDAVEPGIIENFIHILPEGNIYTPYGTTEALRWTLIERTDILAENRAKGPVRGVGFA
jgi:hypothetical protein